MDSRVNRYRVLSLDQGRRLRSLWASFFYISLFTIHFQILPIGVETQPVLPLVLLPFGLLLFRHWNRDRWQILFFLVYVSVLTGHLLIFGGRSLDWAKLLVGPLFLLLPFRWWRAIPISVMAVVVAMVLLITIISLMGFVPLHEALRSVVSERVWVVLGGRRGVSVLTPEPSYFAFFFVTGVVATHRRRTTVPLLLIRIGWIVLALLTISLYVYVMLFLYLGMLLLSRKDLATYGVPAAIIAIVLFALFSDRYEFKTLRNWNPAAWDQGPVEGSSWLNALHHASHSGSARLYTAYLSFKVLLDRPRGMGIGSFPFKWKEEARANDMDLTRHRALRVYFEPGAGPLFPQSYMQALVHDTGWFALALVPYMMYGFRRLRYRARWSFLVAFGAIVFLFFFFQGQMTNPIPWLLLQRLYAGRAGL